MLRFQKAKLMTIILSVFIILGLTLPAGADTGKITGSIVNIRSGPGTNYSVVGNLYCETEVEVLENTSEWSKIYYRDLTGWVSNDLLKMDKEDIRLKVKGELVNLRSGPGTPYSIAGQVEKGDSLILVDIQGEWYKVKTMQGTECYVYAQLVEDENGPVEVFQPVKPDPSVSPSVAATPRVFLDQQQLVFDVDPIIENGRTLVPLRVIFEAMGANVEWDNITRTVTARKGGTSVVLAIGSTTPTVNGQVYQLDVPARIMNDRTLAPLRFVGETFGGQVDWDEATRVIDITTKKSEPEKEVSEVTRVIVTEDIVNLRQGPSTNYSSIDLARSGEGLDVLAQKDGWYQVSRGGSSAWVAGWVVDIDRQAAEITKPGTTEPENNNPVIVKPVEEPEAVEKPQPPAVSFDRALQFTCNVDETGVEVVITAGKAIKPTIKEDKRIIIYEINDKQVISSDITKKLAGGQNITIRGKNQGNNAVIEIELPQELEYITESENSGKREVLFIPNCITGVGRKVVGQTGEIVLIKTLVPAEYGYSYEDGVLTVELESTSTGIAREEYDYTISRLLKKMKVKQTDSESSKPVTKLTIENKSPYKYALTTDDDNTLNIILTLRPKRQSGDAVVVLDAGHGGKESGAVNGSLKEKEINLDIALMVGKILEREKNIQIEYTRIADTDVGLEERAKIANNLDATIFVSIHANSVVNSTPSGTESYFYAPLEIPHLCEQRAQREELAEALQIELLKNLRRIDRGVKEKNLSVLRNTQMPSALVEVAFMSNPAELQLLKQHSFREAAAQAIAKGIINYLGEQ